MVVRYCFDTSAFVEPWQRLYPPDVFPAFWGHVEKLADNGLTVFTNKEVLRELEPVEDDLYAWLKDRNHMVLELEEDVQEAAKIILADHSGLVQASKNRSMADPWVIAHAQVMDATVVTQEQASKNPARKPHIPDVCQALSIPCINVLAFIRETGLNFARK